MDTSFIPDRLECTLAWRAWAVTPEGVLTSLAWNTAWPAEEALVATCNANKHSAPAEECGCGIYATRDEASLKKAIRGHWWWPKRGVVIGQVYLWGTIIEHDWGFRAQRAYPRELRVYDWTDEITAQKLEATYKVPVHRYGRLKGTLPKALTSPLAAKVVTLVTWGLVCIPALLLARKARERYTER